MQETEIQSAARLMVEMSTYMNVILLSSSTEGYEICDRVIQWSEIMERQVSKMEPAYHNF